MKYFTIKELSHSDTAVARGIDNTPTGEAVHNLTELVENVLDPLREKYGKPIRVSSGYRSAVLNRSVNGATSSQHRLGQAADITVGSTRRKPPAFRDHPQGTAFRPADRREGFLLGACVIPQRQKQKTGIKTLKLFSYGRFTAI